MTIRIAGLELGYNGLSILSDLDLEVPEGELVVLLGPNGSGKTTLLRAISGLLRPQKGAVFLDATDVHRLAPEQLATKLAALEQEIHCAFEFRVRETVALGRLPHLRRFGRFSERDRAFVERVMAQCDLLALSDRPVQTLSSGERQRVWLAMALAQEPEVLLLDEPTSHLDINFQIEIMGLIRKLARQGLTVLASLHDLNLAAQFADRLALLAQRRLLAFGRPSEVLTEALIERAYRARVDIIHKGGELYVLPQRAAEAIEA